MRLPLALATVACAFLVAGCGDRGEHPGTSTTSTAPPGASGKATTSTAPGGNEVVATYAGKELTSGRVIEEMDKLPPPSRAYLAQPDRKKQFVENLILNDLLYDEAQKAGYANDPDIERQVQEMRRRLVVQRLMREYQKPPDVSDEDAKKYYDDNPNLYSTTQIHAAHILVRDEDTAKQIRAELEKEPGRFEDIAREKSIDRTSGQKGGDLGKFGQGRMVPDFEKVAFSLKPGEVSQPVKTQYGWHVIKLIDREEGQRKPFDQVKEQIKATLRNKALQENVQAKFDALKKSANVHIDDAKLTSVNPPPPSPDEAAKRPMSPH